MHVLGIFAKYWQPGKVKTRLARGVGPVAAAGLQREFLRLLLERFADAGDRRVIGCWPADRQSDFAALAGPAWSTTAQCDGDLGQRMESFFAETLQSADDRVVLIGADSPTLPWAYVEDAFQRLASQPVVLGPTHDGGYYLVGVAGRVPHMFARIPWGTSQVWSQTVRQLQTAAIPFAQLPPWYDVDELTDLLRLRAELASMSRDDPTWRPLRDAIDAALSPDGPCTIV